MPKTDLTTELKRDLEILQMRSVIDPKRHYKKGDTDIRTGKRSFAPDFSQTGTVIEGPTDFIGGRISKKQRKDTFVQEVLSTKASTARFKREYEQVQRMKVSGRKGRKKLGRKR